MKFPQKGRDAEDLLQHLGSLKQHDVPWQEGRVFAYIYDAGPEAMGLVKDAFSLFLVENGLDPTSFPSCLELEKEVIGMAIDLVNAGPEAKGSFTSGGTESILLSLKTARDRARDLYPHITQPEIVICETGHPAFHKACAYFDLKAVTVPADPHSYQAVPAAMEAAVTDQTILMVGSAPSYAHGVIDPIPELGEIAQRHEILLHVDCCVGGMYLPFAKELGYGIPDFDLSVPGTTQLSMDFHKWGYAAKGASSILYKHGDMRKHQIFAWSGWTGYTVINPTVSSTKSGGPVAACWSILRHLGKDGYLRMVEGTQQASRKIIDAVRAMPALDVMGDPQANLFALTSEQIDVFALAEEMKVRGWYIQPQFGYSNSTANLHLSVGFSNVPHVDEFIRDLSDCERQLREKKIRGIDSLPPELAAALNGGAGGNVFETLAAATGKDFAELPDRMDEINNLLNHLPAPVRDQLMVEFVNRLYVSE